jgi:hypothetical protein
MRACSEAPKAEEVGMSPTFPAMTQVPRQALPVVELRRRLRRATAVAVGTLLGCLLLDVYSHGSAVGAQPGNVVVYLEQRFGLTEPQSRGALGALLIFAQERLSKSDFDELAQRVPNADAIMADIKLQGIVTRPLDNIAEYQQTLSSLGIGQPLASQIAPAVVDYLGQTGRTEERDILASVLD